MLMVSLLCTELEENCEDEGADTEEYSGFSSSGFSASIKMHCSCVINRDAFKQI